MLLAEVIPHDLVQQEHVFHVLDRSALPCGCWPPESVARVPDVGIVVVTAIELALDLLVPTSLRHPARNRSALALDKRQVLKVFVGIKK